MTRKSPPPESQPSGAAHHAHKGPGPVRQVIRALPTGHNYLLSCGHHVKLRDPLPEFPCHHCRREENSARAVEAAAEMRR